MKFIENFQVSHSLTANQQQSLLLFVFQIHNNPRKISPVDTLVCRQCYQTSQSDTKMWNTWVWRRFNITTTTATLDESMTCNRFQFTTYVDLLHHCCDDLNVRSDRVKWKWIMCESSNIIIIPLQAMRRLQMMILTFGVHRHVLVGWTQNRFLWLILYCVECNLNHDFTVAGKNY